MSRFVAVAAVLVAIAGCSQPSNEVMRAEQLRVTSAEFNQEGAPTVEFSVPDMMCPEGCGVAVEEILAKQPGVKDVLVDFDAKKATVAVEEGKFDCDKALAALVDKQFFNSSLNAAPHGEPAAKSAVH